MNMHTNYWFPKHKTFSYSKCTDYGFLEMKIESFKWHNNRIKWCLTCLSTKHNIHWTIFFLVPCFFYKSFNQSYFNSLQRISVKKWDYGKQIPHLKLTGPNYDYIDVNNVIHPNNWSSSRLGTLNPVHVWYNGAID